MFEGVHTAIATPFSSDGSVDYDALKRFVDFQVDGGVSGVVPVGTTGESPTLKMDEHKKVIETVIQQADGRILVTAGTGGNSTFEALELTEFAQKAGADATLQVTPYYNKPTNKGLYEHFSIVADVGLPVMLYHVPGRSACGLDIKLVEKLAEHQNVVAIKEAEGGPSIQRTADILSACDIEVVSGDDPLTLPMMVNGAVGCVSVASNIIPGIVTNLVNFALQGMWTDAIALHRQYNRLFTGMFSETNPIPVKTALGHMGIMEGVFRPPLCSMEDDSGDELVALLKEFELLS